MIKRQARDATLALFPNCFFELVFMVFRFGPHELNSNGFELRRAGRRVHLASRPMELLFLLVERHGKLVSREEIARSLWPGLQPGDLVARINTAVAQIRASLQEDASKPRYIETVIGKGYRFVGAVVVSAETPSTTAPSDEDGSACEAIDIPTGWPAVAERASSEGSTKSAVALLDLPVPVALPANPADSAPDAVDPPAVWVLPVVIVLVAMILGWIYRGRFYGNHPEPSPLVADRQITTNDAEYAVSVAAISPDATLLAYMDPTGIFIVELATGRTRQIPGPNLRATRIAWFADQAHLVLTGLTPEGDRPEIWVLGTADRVPRLFRRDADNGVPAPDGSSIAFTANNGSEILLAAPDGTGERSVTRGREGELFSALFWSPDGTRLNFEQRSAPEHPSSDFESNFVWSYRSMLVATGRETAVVNDLPFEWAGETVDGSLFYMRTRPTTDQAHNGIWKIKIDPRTGGFLGKPVRLAPFGLYDLWTGMSISRKGEIAALKQDWRQNVYYGDLSDANKKLSDVQALTSNVATDCPHSWDLHGKVVYFESNRVGHQYHLFRKAILSANAEMLTVGDGQQFFPTLMADGKTLVYEQSQQNGDRAIYRARDDGKQATLVLKEDPLDEWRCPTMPGAGCVLRKTEGQRSFAFYALDLTSGKRQQIAYTAWQPTLLGDWALSPDGKTVALPNHEPGSPTIRLLSLDGRQRESVIRVHQTAQLWGLHWAQDGQGFFAQVRNGARSRMQFIDNNGNVSVLRETTGNTWAIPSRDGNKLAFVDSVEAQNVFLWH